MNWNSAFEKNKLWWFILFLFGKNIEIKIENITIFNWKCAIKDVWLSADKLQIFLISLITILRKKELEFSL